MYTTETVGIDTGGNAAIVVMAGGGVSIASAAFGVGQVAGANPPPVAQLAVSILPEVACYVRQGVTPVATNDGTDMYLIANTLRKTFVAAGNKLAFNATTGGNVHVWLGH